MPPEIAKVMFPAVVSPSSAPTMIQIKGNDHYRIFKWNTECSNEKILKVLNIDILESKCTYKGIKLSICKNKIAIISVLRVGCCNQLIIYVLKYIPCDVKI